MITLVSGENQPYFITDICIKINLTYHLNKNSGLKSVSKRTNKGDVCSHIDRVDAESKDEKKKDLQHEWKFSVVFAVLSDFGKKQLKKTLNSSRKVRARIFLALQHTADVEQKTTNEVLTSLIVMSTNLFCRQKRIKRRKNECSWRC